MHGERAVSVIGVARKQANHPRDCGCEMCGPLFLLGLSEYEATRLSQMLEATAGNKPGIIVDSGDWHGQIRYKLRDLLGVA